MNGQTMNGQTMNVQMHSQTTDNQTNIFLVAGYRRTGKDTLFQMLNGVKFPFNWSIYSATEQTLEIGDYHRIAFADKLKVEVSQYYGIPRLIPDDHKEIKQFWIADRPEPVSARDLYIEWGAVRRAQNPNYWCAASLLGLTPGQYIVTDWRFANEYDFSCSTYPTTTIRIFRNDVPIPDSSINSEHELDHHLTDFLLTNDFEAAVRQFPQYASYRFVEKL